MKFVDFTAAFLLITLSVDARSIEKRQAGDNSYGDEPSLPPTLVPYQGAVEVTTYEAVPEEEAQSVENVVPTGTATVVDSGYRVKRQAGDNSYGDEPALPSQLPYEGNGQTTLAVIPEVVPQPIPMSPSVIPVTGVVESGY